MSPAARLALAALVTAACRASDPPTDVPTGLDADVVHGVPVDARPDASADAAPDASADAAPDADLRPYDPCAASAIRDLDALGTRTGATTRVVADNRSVGRLGPLDAPCARGMVGHQVVFRYVPRTTTRLRVSTNDEATDARLDTVVFATLTCGPVPDGATALGCSDDTGDPPRDHATTFVTDANVRAGEPVYIVVSGFLHATRELWDSQGTFALSVTEQ
jgi:hypothetical protein